MGGCEGATPLGNQLRAYVPTASERPDVRRVLQLMADGSPWDRRAPLHVTASALIVHPPSRRVLLRWHERQQAWLQIGGHADPGEGDPLAVALREGEEETGLPDLTPWPDAALRHVVVVPVPANKREPAHEHADLRFVLKTQHPESSTSRASDGRAAMAVYRRRARTHLRGERPRDHSARRAVSSLRSTDFSWLGRSSTT